jgi:signal peptidase II
MRSPLGLGIAIALLTFSCDQASKLWLLFAYDLPAREPLILGPYVSFIVVWNRGISYGLFQQNSELGRWALIAVSVIATVAITVWLNRTTSRPLALALGLIAGGALGNLVDRLAYGAVFDFVYLHAGRFSWYVFNLADAAIVAGVVGLLYDSVRPRKTHSSAV